MWQLERLHPRILVAWKHEQEGLGPPLQYGDAYAQLSHFADEYEDMKLDARSQLDQRKNEAYDILHPSLSALQYFFDQIISQPYFEIHGIFGKLQI